MVVRTSYGGSGSQTRAVIDGLAADVVGLALTADTLRLQEAGLIRPGWERENPNNSIITNSVVAFFVRPGNPGLRHQRVPQCGHPAQGCPGSHRRLR